MKQKKFILTSLILFFNLTVLFTSCSNDCQNYVSTDISKSTKILEKYANIHNSGLDYIKFNVEKNSNEKCTRKYMESTLEDYIINVYGNDDALKIIRQIATMENLVFSGNIPHLAQMRNNTSADKSNTIAIEAANECINNISDHLKTCEDDELFDNQPLLDDLHVIINNTYNIYTKKCRSDEEQQILSQALGVLYGSIEYWTNSENVEFWSKLDIEDNNDIYSKDVSINKAKKEKSTNKSSKKLSKAEYIEIIAAADTAGSFLGGAVASGPAAIAASAAAALYFDVE